MDWKQLTHIGVGSVMIQFCGTCFSRNLKSVNCWFSHHSRWSQYVFKEICICRMISSIKTEGALKLRCAENIPMQRRRSSSCLILTLQSRHWLMFEPWTTEYWIYQTLRLTLGKRCPSNRLWELVVILSGPLLNPQHPAVFEKGQGIHANPNIQLFSKTGNTLRQCLVHPRDIVSKY